MASTGPETQADGGQWFPPHWPERIRALVRGDLTAAEPRPAATVMLLRPGTRSAGTEVFLLRRRLSMEFAGGAYAYPGGSVDPRDQAPVSWAGDGPAGWAHRLGVEPAHAQAVVCAAVRETFEEAGVLLAATADGQIVPDTTGESWEADRRALVAREESLAGLLARRSLVLRDDLLAPWARWITPEIEDRRYDTWFFAAALPEGQRSRNASTEADRAEWVAPADAVAGYDRGELLMMPPTIATLRTLLPYPGPGAALADGRRRDLTPVQATARISGAQIVLSWPGHPEFEQRVSAAAAGDAPASGHPAAPTTANVPGADPGPPGPRSQEETP